MKWLERRKTKQKCERYERGFGYAMSEYHLNGKSLMELTLETDAAKKLNVLNDFDYGILAAVDIIKMRH